jgi:hypothetical protein
MAKVEVMRMLLSKRLVEAFCLAKEGLATIEEGDPNSKVQKCQEMF